VCERVTSEGRGAQSHVRKTLGSALPQKVMEVRGGGSWLMVGCSTAECAYWGCGENTVFRSLTTRIKPIQFKLQAFL
jgi:hypothetical protein